MKWLHLSDIHYNPKNDGRSTQQLRDKLPQYIIDKKITADYLFVTGDFRHAKYQKDDDGTTAKNAVQFILRIADAARIDHSNIYIVPGNHDLSRSEDKLRINEIKNCYNAHDGRFQDRDLIFLKERFVFFQQIVSELKAQGVPAPLPEKHSYWHGVTEIPECNLLFLNTCIICNSNEDRGSLIIGNYDLYHCLEELRQKSPLKPVIVLAHHGMDNFRTDERKAVENLFRDYPIKLYLCGDAHTPWRRSTNKFVEITMGGLLQDNNVRTVFSVGEMEKEKIQIKAHEWDADTNRWGEYTQLNDELNEIFGCVGQSNQKMLDPLHLQLRNQFKRVRNRDRERVSEEAISLASVLWETFQDGYAGIYLLDLARLRNDTSTIEKLYVALNKSEELTIRTAVKKWYLKWGEIK